MYDKEVEKITKVMNRSNLNTKNDNTTNTKKDEAAKSDNLRNKSTGSN
jgi:hypothetical protein